jgi:hypothetical protein
MSTNAISKFKRFFSCVSADLKGKRRIIYLVVGKPAIDQTALVGFEIQGCEWAASSLEKIAKESEGNERGPLFPLQSLVRLQSTEATSAAESCRCPRGELSRTTDRRGFIAREALRNMDKHDTVPQGRFEESSL